MVVLHSALDAVDVLHGCIYRIAGCVCSCSKWWCPCSCSKGYIDVTMFWWRAPQWARIDRMECILFRWWLMRVRALRICAGALLSEWLEFCRKSTQAIFKTPCGLYSHMDQQWRLNPYDGNTHFHNYYRPMELSPLEPTRKIKLQRNHDRTPDIGVRTQHPSFG